MWRSASDYASTVEYDRGGFSWELLRRNPEYQRDYDFSVIHSTADGEAAPIPAVWGCDFAANPTVAAAHQPIFWTEAASPAVLMFGGASPDDSAGLESTQRLLAAAAVRQGEDGLHAVWRWSSHQLQGRFEPSATARGLAVILPLDSAVALRALTAIRLARLLRRTSPGPDPAPLSLARRARLVQVLRALDGRADGASLRDIAEGLFGRRVAGRAWQDSDLQARTRRLVRSGLELMRGGYRELLNPLARRPSPPRDESLAP